MSDALSLFLAGDALITRPWSHVKDPSFLRLVDEIRAADVSITNLETVIHAFKGYAQAQSGGTYMASPPEVADELKWAGFDMLAHANNHSFDYGSTGVLETIEHAERAGLVLAGSGKDLQAARAPRSIRCNGGVVALVAMASDFIPYGKASFSRPDLPGRPGLNPLAVTGGNRAILVPATVRKRLQPLTRLGLRFRTSDHYGLVTGFRVSEADLRANLDAIATAATKADVVVASVHAHRQGPWLTTFAHQAIEHGAAIVFIHGPHKVKAIELFKGRPIFYSMGDFVYEAPHITRFPAETYEQRGLPPDAAFAQLAATRSPAAKLDRRQTYEGLAAEITLAQGAVTRLRLIPLDLQFHAASEDRGRPRLAAPALGRDIIARAVKASKPFGTRILWREESGCGEVALGG